MTELTVPTISEPPQVSRKWVIFGGRVLLALLLLLAWEIGARTLGAVFFAPPLQVLERIGELARNGRLAADVVATLRVAALGFAIACVVGVLLPFLLRRSQRI